MHLSVFVVCACLQGVVEQAGIVLDAAVLAFTRILSLGDDSGDVQCHKAVARWLLPNLQVPLQYLTAEIGLA